MDVLKSNSGRIAEEWAAAAAKVTYSRGTNIDMSESERVDRLKRFYDALMDRAANPSSRKAHEILKSEIRAEHSRNLTLSGTIKKQGLLRDIMAKVAEDGLPDMPKNTIRLAVDSMIDRSIEGTVMMLEEYTEMQSALSRWISGAPYVGSSLDQALTRFCRNAMDYFESEFVAVFDHPPRSLEMICLAYSSKGLAFTKNARIPLNSIPSAAEVIFKKQTSNTCGTDEAAKKRKVAGAVSFANCISVPMIRDDEVVGVFLVGDNARSLPFIPEEVSIAEDLAKQLLRVLQNAELFQLLSIRSRAQKSLLETAASLQQEIESEEIYRIIATKLTELIPSNELAFYVYDWERRVGNPVYAVGPWAAQTMADRDFLADLGIAGYIARSKKAEIVLDTETDPRAEQIPGTPAAHTRMLAVPVVGQKEVLGVIELLRYPPESFTQEDLEIATLFANHASVALENAKLLSALRAAREEVELSIDLLTHDIANYATPINAYFDTLKTKKNVRREIADVVEKTSKQVEGIMRLVDMVRTLAKLREASPKELRKIDLKQTIEECAADVRKHTTIKKVDIEVRLPESPMLVMADDMVKDMFTNLFFGAALSDKQDPTKLSVVAEPRKENKNEYWWVMVSQPSRSIPDTLKSEVLRMSKSSKSELAGGFGIGLAAAKGVVTHYSGMMWVSDIATGDYTKGCIFNILLPRAL